MFPSFIRPKSKKVTMAHLDLSDCPEGKVLDRFDPDSKVDLFFEGWENPLTPVSYWGKPSNLMVVSDEGNPVLEYYKTVNRLGNEILFTRERCLITGDMFWRDYEVDCNLRIIGTHAEPNYDNSEMIIPWAGIMFRYQDLRHYYFFCLQNQPLDNKIVLYRRADNDWHILAQIAHQIDPEKYYSLMVKISGNHIRCHLEGEQIFEVTDYLYKKGKAGVRFNTESRVRNIKIFMMLGEERIFLDERNRNWIEINTLRKRYPKPVLCNKIDLSCFWPFNCVFANLRSEKSKDFLLFCGEPNSQMRITSWETQKVVAISPIGELLWERQERLVPPPSLNTKGRLNSWLASSMICSSDGKAEIPVLTKKKIIILDGSSGETMRETPLPPLEKAFTYGSLDIKVGNINGKREAKDIILKAGTAEGGEDLWAYDANLHLIWKTSVTPRYGHQGSVMFYDIDGDGRDEILAGGTLLNPEGEMIWRVEGHERITNTLGGGHVDATVIGKFADDEDLDPIAYLANGSAGLWVVDALTGEVRDIHQIGHAQGIAVGKFRPSTSGLQVLAGCRWDNYGILNLFSGRGERLLTFEPDNVSQGADPINWTGDGSELIPLMTSPKALGLWDGFGRKIVTFPEDNLPEKVTTYYGRNWAGWTDLYGDSREEIILCAQGKIHIFTQEEDNKTMVDEHQSND